MTHYLAKAIAATLLALLATHCAQADWPLYRGNALAQGVADEALADNLELKWKLEVEDGAFEATPVVVDQVAYIGDLDGRVYALKLEDGSKVWTYAGNVEQLSGFMGSPAYRDGRIYVGDIDGVLHCLDAKDGKLLWKFEAGLEINGSVNFYQDKILIGSQDATLYCLNQTDGTLAWKVEIDDQIRCMPTVVANRGFVAGCDSKLHVIDLDAGKAIGTVPIDGPTGSAPAVRDDVAYFGTEAGTFYAIDWKQLKVVWQYEDARNRQQIRASAAVLPDRVIFGSFSKNLVSLDRTTGQPQWTFKAKGKINSSPVVAGQRVYFGSGDSRVRAVDIATGKEVWQYEAKSGFPAGPAVSDGCLLIASERGVVYCFGPKT
ncbi:PQQ-binding-like beta-propeller repeat protein [Blastopirellula marina]|uniref:Serine/threonine protein kinase n=1 Tax=Blastopirellula marina TaxID=124 RepID=A0A2S8F839_9BACT|nr:PQQ-binding-like beta-propeller repeat protein [Blastopirellula marina]PQO28332.1 serine/threonine protein kinase [Blastopirellula marina]PTL41872.1 serine/threonine protein kinase [Blastopirellula marina]